MSPVATFERELKLDIARDFVLPGLPGRPLDPRSFTSTYVDTDDRRLARLGMTLRRRVEQRKGVWQLKLPRGAARLELEAPGGPTSPPAELTRLLVAVLRGRSLLLVAKLRTQRSTFRVVENRRGVAEVAIDRVAVLDDRRVVDRFAELEVELLRTAPDHALRPIGKTLRKAGAKPGDGMPKVFRVLGRPAAPGPGSGDGVAAHLGPALSAQVDAMLRHDPGVRVGGDPEDVHQLRVATRRLRAILRAVRPFVPPGWEQPLRDELKWLASQLGSVRDLDVLIEQLRGDAETFGPEDKRALAGLLTKLEKERKAARAALLESLESDRYLALLDALEAAAAAPPVTDASASLESIAGGEFKKLRNAVGGLPPHPTDEELHAVRVKGKRARYAAELSEPVTGKAATRFVAAAKRFQDVIGEHQDAVVLEQRLRAVAGQGDAAFAAGRLAERQRERRLKARAAFPKAWAKLEASGRRAWS